MRRIAQLIALVLIVTVSTIVVYTAASYPSATKSFTTKTAGQTIASAHVNEIQDEIVAIENGLLSGFGHTIKPLADNTYDNGTSSLGWRDLFVKRNLTHLGYAGTGAALVSNASKQIVEQALTNGQVIVGSTGVAPVAATLTGSALTVTNGAGTITLTPNSRVLDKSTTEQDVVNTATETAVYTYTVTGGTLSTANPIRVTMTGGYFNNVGASVFFSVKYGGTIIAGGPNGTGAAYGGGAFGATALRHPFVLQTTLNANGATNSQRVVTRAQMYTGAATETDWNAATNDNGNMKTNLAVDSTVDQTLTITVQHSAANANISFKRYAVIVELLQ